MSQRGWVLINIFYTPAKVLDYTIVFNYAVIPEYVIPETVGVSLKAQTQTQTQKFFYSTLKIHNDFKNKHM